MFLGRKDRIAAKKMQKNGVFFVGKEFFVIFALPFGRELKKGSQILERW